MTRRHHLGDGGAPEVERPVGVRVADLVRVARRTVRRRRSRARLRSPTTLPRRAGTVLPALGVPAALPPNISSTRARSGGSRTRGTPTRSARRHGARRRAAAGKRRHRSSARRRRTDRTAGGRRSGSTRCRAVPGNIRSTTAGIVFSSTRLVPRCRGRGRTSPPAGRSRCSRTRARAWAGPGVASARCVSSSSSRATKSSSSGGSNRREHAVLPHHEAELVAEIPERRGSRRCRSRRRRTMFIPGVAEQLERGAQLLDGRGDRHDVGWHPDRAAAEDRYVVHDEREAVVGAVDVDGAEPDRRQLDRWCRRPRAARDSEAGRRGCAATSARRRGGGTCPATVLRVPPSCATREGCGDVADAELERAWAVVPVISSTARTVTEPPRSVARASRTTTRPRVESLGTSSIGRHGPTGAAHAAQPSMRPSSVVRIHRRFCVTDQRVLFQRGRGRRPASTGVSAANRMHSSLSGSSRSISHSCAMNMFVAVQQVRRR